MKTKVLSLWLVVLGFLLQKPILAQTPYTYTTMLGTSQNMYAWSGTKVAMLALSDTLHNPTMTTWLNTLDQAYNYYKTCTGQDPNPYFTYNGKLSMAQVGTTACGGAACGYLGSTGIEIMTPYFYECYDPLRSQGLYNQVPFYELGRNFWYYGSKLNYGSYDLATSYAIFMRFKSMEYANAPGAPFGAMPFATFKEAIRMNMDIYRADTNYTWANTFGTGQMVAGGFGGTSDLFASLFMYLDARTCNSTWTKNFWKYAGQRPNATSVQDAVDNFIIASCLASNENQIELFEELNWPISQAAAAYIQSIHFGAISNQPPFRVSTQLGNDVTIPISSGVPTAAFRWHEMIDGTPVQLNNTSTFGGVSTSNLIINNVTLADSNSTYVCRVIIAGCDTVFSDPTQLIVFTYEEPVGAPLHVPTMYAGSVNLNQPELLTSNAGDDLTDPDGSLVLGGSPTAAGGQPPYTYTWTPALGLDNPQIANPTYIDSIDANYQLTVTDNRGCVSTDSISVLILSIENTDGAPIQFTAYPNPVSDVLKIQCPNIPNERVTISLFDPEGKLVSKEQFIATGPSHVHSFDVQHLAKGNYLLRLEFGLSTITSPIIIRH
jgi:hypothetical protein